MREFIFISENAQMKDVDLFFQSNIPIDITFQFFKTTDILAHLIYKTGFFSSVSQAKKNGWNKPIPLGFSSYILGKKKIQILIWNHID